MKWTSLAIILLLFTTPTAAQQASGIAGTVRDTSGSVLPGVTVEAASPALIEKVRSVITDGQGQYNIVDLRPGAYTVTLTLPGFATVKRDGIILTAGFTATVNGELRVGAVEETITVSAASPLIDAKNVRQLNVISQSVLEALPTSSAGVTLTLSTLTPGLTGQVLAGTSGNYAGQTTVGGTFHGKGGIKILFDGMRVQNMEGSGANGYVVNAASVEEMTAETGGVTAESNASGVVFNAIPRDGGNTFRFGAQGLFTNDSLQSGNLTDDLRARGLTTVNKVNSLYEENVTLGGPIRRDRVWFFSSQRYAASDNQLAGLFYNKTQGSPLYTPDPDRPANRTEQLQSYATRVTWQLSRRNKLAAFADIQHNCVCMYAGTAGTTGNILVAPEAVSRFMFWPQGLFQLTWNTPITNRLLLEAGASVAISHWPNTPQPEVGPNDISTLEQSTGFTYNSLASLAVTSYGDTKTSDRFAQRFSMSYVTGSHAIKTGFQIEEGIHDVSSRINGDVSYRFNRGVPNQITQYATPYLQKERLRADLGLFAQDQWTLKRLTVNAGLRFDYLNAYVPEQHVPAGPFVPARDFAAVGDVPRWSDVNPRLGASYDLFGDGRTAFKMSLGRYLGATAIDIAAQNNPMATSVNSVNRTWTDNGNFVPDCDLKNPAQNGECGPYQNPNFGKLNVTTRFADDTIRGFGNRDNFWDFGAEAQHQLLSALSVKFGYFRNSYGNFRVTDNLAVSPSDYSEYCITAPVDARLPNGGGYQVCGLYDVAPAKFGLVNNLVQPASAFGKQTRVSDFFNVMLNSRFGRGILVGGGIDTGRTVTDKCFVIDSPTQAKYDFTSATAPTYCHIATPFKGQTDIKGFASYPLPRDFVVSATYQNGSGPVILANYVATNTEIAPSLGRNLAAGTAGTATVPLIVPQTRFEKRRSQLDVRVGKVFKFSSDGRFQVNVDVYNLLNNAAVLGLNPTYGSQWLKPIALGTTGTAILTGRLVQFSGNVKF